MKKTMITYGHASVKADPDLMKIRFTMKESDKIYEEALKRLQKMQLHILRLFNEKGFDVQS